MCLKILSIQKFSGDNIYEETPVPIPNTEVKLIIAENTCELPCWEDKMSPVFLCPKTINRIFIFLNFRYKNCK